jgi:hypothetical protein
MQLWFCGKPAFYRELGLDPVEFASAVFANIGISQRRQITGGLFGCRSPVVCTIHDDFLLLIRQKAWRELLHLFGRHVDRAGQMNAFVHGHRKSLDEDKIIAPINFPFQFVACNRSAHIAIVWGVAWLCAGVRSCAPVAIER